MAMIDMRGRRFGRLVVAVEDVTNKRGDAQWGCLCDCGGRVTVRGDSLRRGATLSCGCIRRETNRKTALDRPKAEPKPRKPRQRRSPTRKPVGDWRALKDAALAKAMADIKAGKLT
jgi:hypothetical protein